MTKQRVARADSDVPIDHGSGNVYADLGFNDAAVMLAKARIVERIGHLLRELELTQVQAARLLGISQPKVSALLRGHFDGYSQERLIGLLNRLGCDVEIIVKRVRRGKSARRAGQLSVTFA